MRLTNLALVSSLAFSLVLATPTLSKAEDSAAKPEAKATEQAPEKHIACAGMAEKRLPEVKEKLVFETFDKAMKEDKATREASFRLHQEIKALFAAPEFSQEAYLKKSEELRNLKAILEQHHAATMADIAKALTPEERKIFAEHMPMGMHGPQMGMGMMGMQRGPEKESGMRMKHHMKHGDKGMGRMEGKGMGEPPVPPEGKAMPMADHEGAPHHPPMAPPEAN